MLPEKTPEQVRLDTLLEVKKSLEDAPIIDFETLDHVDKEITLAKFDVQLANVRKIIDRVNKLTHG